MSQDGYAMSLHGYHQWQTPSSYTPSHKDVWSHHFGRAVSRFEHHSNQCHLYQSLCLLISGQDNVIPGIDGERPQYILMETSLDTSVTTEDEIPLFAVIPGIIKSFQFGDTKIFGKALCGLRDKHIHPDVWHTIESVQDYTIYTIIFK